MKNMELMKQALAYRNFLAEKKRNDLASFLELGFSNDGRLPKYTPAPKPKQTAGFINFIRQLKP